MAAIQERAPVPGSGRTCSRAPRGGARRQPAGSVQGAVPPVVAQMQQQAARLARLEQAMEEGGAVVPGENSAEMMRAASQEVVEAAFDELAGRINGFEGALAKMRQPEAADLAYFRNKTEEIETTVADLKRLLLKVQSFAMETNCTMLKLSGRVEKLAGVDATKDRDRNAAGVAQEATRKAWEEGLEERVHDMIDAKVQALAASCPVYGKEENSDGDEHHEEVSSEVEGEGTPDDPVDEEDVAEEGSG